MQYESTLRLCRNAIDLYCTVLAIFDQLWLVFCHISNALPNAISLINCKGERYTYFSHFLTSLVNANAIVNSLLVQTKNKMMHRKSSHTIFTKNS